jgi:putative DNA primase/helicase
MASAIRIARWHLQETRRIFGQLAIPDDVHTAQKLLDWLLTRKQPTITPRQIAQYGPNSLRHDKRNRETVLLKLCEHRYLGVEKTGKRTVYHLHPSLLEAGV